MIETANPAFYSASAIELDSLQRVWPETAPAPFLVRPATRIVPDEASSFSKVRSGIEMTASVIWIIACAAASILWVAIFRIQPKNRGVK